MVERRGRVRGCLKTADDIGRTGGSGAGEGGLTMIFIKSKVILALIVIFSLIAGGYHLYTGEGGWTLFMSGFLGGVAAEMLSAGKISSQNTKV